MLATKPKDPDWKLAEAISPKVGCSTMQAVRWIRTGTKPRNPLVAAAWTKALTAAKAKAYRIDRAKVSAAFRSGQLRGVRRGRAIFVSAKRAEELFGVDGVSLVVR